MGYFQEIHFEFERSVGSYDDALYVETNPSFTLAYSILSEVENVEELLIFIDC